LELFGDELLVEKGFVVIVLPRLVYT